MVANSRIDLLVDYSAHFVAFDIALVILDTLVIIQYPVVVVTQELPCRPPPKQSPSSNTQAPSLTNFVNSFVIKMLSPLRPSTEFFTGFISFGLTAMGLNLQMLFLT